MTKEAVYSKLGLKDLSRVKYEIDRYFLHTPGVIQIDIMVNDHVLQSIKSREELETMASFGTFQETNGTKGNYEYPYASSDEKSALYNYDIPFEIKAVRVVEGRFEDPETHEVKNQIEYDVAIDTESDAWKVATRKKQLKTTYRISFAVNNYRLNEMENLINPEIREHGSMPAMLTKFGRAYGFKDIED